MDILSHERSLYEGIVSEDVLLAGLAGLGLNGLLNSVTVSHLAGFESLKVGRALCDGHVSDSLSEILEIRIAAHEVSLAAKAYKDALVSGHARLYRTLGSLAVSPLGGHKLSLLTDDVDGLVEVACGFFKSLLAVHHSRRSHFT